MLHDNLRPCSNQLKGGCHVDGGEDRFKWSGGLRIQPLLHLCSQNDGKVARQMGCASLESPAQTYKFNLNVVKMAKSEGRESKQGFESLAIHTLPACHFPKDPTLQICFLLHLSKNNMFCKSPEG